MEAEAKPTEIDRELKKRIKKTVKKILQNSSLYQMTEKKAREEASTQLNLDPSEEPYKLVVREAVESFIEETMNKIDTQKEKNRKEKGEEVEEKKEKTQQQRKEGEEEKKKKKKSKKKPSSS